MDNHEARRILNIVEMMAKNQELLISLQKKQHDKNPWEDRIYKIFVGILISFLTLLMGGNLWLTAKIVLIGG